uniref:hypothetical protein n=2 Tax=uncultured Vibrio sp. TaxID=114054 RepID=UPI0026248DB6
TAPYALKSHRPLIGAVSAVVVLLTGLLIMMNVGQSNSPTVPTAAPKPPPYQAYQDMMSNAKSASHALNYASQLAPYGASAPQGWTFESLQLQGKEVVATLNRDDDGLLSYASTWLNAHPHGDIATLNTKTLVFRLPIEHTLEAWRERMVPFSFHYTLADALTQLGWLVSDTKNKEALTSTLVLTLKKQDAVVSDWRSLGTLFASLPVSVTQMHMTPNRDGTYQSELVLHFTGDNE